MSAPYANQPQGYTPTSLQTMTPESLALLKKLFGALGSGPEGGLDYLSRLAAGDEDIFQQIEAPAYQKLEQNLAQTANRFSQLGAQGSSAFQNQLAGQSSQMATDLAAQRHQLMSGAIDKLLGFTTGLMGQKPYETFLQKDDTIDWGTLIGKFPELAIKLYAASKGAPIG